MSEATTTSSALASSTSAADGQFSVGGNLKIVGILLAVCSGVLIGCSFVFKKKGLLKSQVGGAAGEGVGYLKSPLWWIGMTMMIVGEICNFAAYAFVEAIVVTPLGALSVVVCAILSSFFLKEKLSFFGWLGCALCILGSIIIALNGPTEQTVSEIREFQKLFLAPGFLAYAGTLIAASLVIVLYFAPKYGKKHMLWYIFVCSMIGGISVSVTTGLGAAIVRTAQGDNQFKYWFIYFLAGFVIVTLLVEIYYLNIALALFNTAMVTPTYYVIFTFFTLVTTVVLFQGLSASVQQILTIVLAFLTICIGITVLQMSKVDPESLQKLDRRSTILLQAARQRTEALEEKSMLGVEDPGMDALRGSFGTIGSIVRARSARRMSQSSHAPDRQPRGVAHSYNPHAPSWVSNRLTRSSEADEVDQLGLKRHQLYDAPMPRSPGLEHDNISLKSPSIKSESGNKRPTIKFGSQDVVHSYHPTKDGQADAKHEHRAAHSPQTGGYPPRPSTEASSSAPLVDVSPPSPQDDLSVGLTVPTRLRDPSEAQSAPATMVGEKFGRVLPGRMDSRNIFAERQPPTPITPGSQASLHSFPSVTDSARSVSWEEGGKPGLGKPWTDSFVSSTSGLPPPPSPGGKREKSRSRERGRSAKKYPKGDGDDDRAESVSLWHRDDEGDNEDVLVGGDGDELGGGQSVRLVGNSTAQSSGPRSPF